MKKKLEISDLEKIPEKSDKINLIKLSIFLFFIFILLNSKFWNDNVLKKIKLMDNFNVISPFGYVFNGFIFTVIFLILYFLIITNDIF